MTSMKGNEGETLSDLFYPVYEKFFSDENNDFKDKVNTKLAEATRDTPVELFLSRSIGIGVLSGTGLTVVVLAMMWVVFGLIGYDPGVLLGIPIQNETVLNLLQIIKVPAIVTITSIIAGVTGFTAGFFAPYLALYLESSARGREINMLLPDSVAFMYALSIGGMNQLDILEAVAKADDVYGSISEEFEIILQETRYFGVDYRTAIRTRAMETPSDEFGQFLTDMLSILSSGGNMTDFLEDKRQKYMRTATQQQQQTLETLELFGEMYMTLSLFPLLLIILLVIMTLIGSSNNLLLFMTVYALIPLTGIIFLVLISTVKQDDPGDGYLIPESGDPYISGKSNAMGRGVIDSFSTDISIMSKIRDSEGSYKAYQIIKRPDKFFEYPQYTFLVSVPIAMILIGYAALSGVVTTTWDGMKQAPVWSTFVYIYIPMYIVSLPYAITYELRERRRAAITRKLSANLRKLASANDTGQTLLESFRTVSETSSGMLSTEFKVIYKKVQYGISMKQALIEFNNKYHRPRLARMIKLIAKAQETSENITPVLKTAANASEQADDLAMERKQRSRMQIAIIIMTYLTLLAVMAILKTQFLDVMANLTEAVGSSGGGGAAGAGGAGFNGVNVPKLSLLFFHAVTFQGIMASLISGYLRSGKLQDGMKYMLVLPTIALVVWLFV